MAITGVSLKSQAIVLIPLLGDEDAAYLVLMTTVMVVVIFYLDLLLGEEASPSIGNTLWRVSTMFTCSAITPPEANGFG